MNPFGRIIALIVLPVLMACGASAQQHSEISPTAMRVTAEYNNSVGNIANEAFSIIIEMQEIDQYFMQLNDQTIDFETLERSVEYDLEYAEYRSNQIRNQLDEFKSLPNDYLDSVRSTGVTGYTHAVEMQKLLDKEISLIRTLVQAVKSGDAKSIESTLAQRANTAVLAIKSENVRLRASIEFVPQDIPTKELQRKVLLENEALIHFLQFVRYYFTDDKETAEHHLGEIEYKLNQSLSALEEAEFLNIEYRKSFIGQREAFLQTGIELADVFDREIENERDISKLTRLWVELAQEIKDGVYDDKRPQLTTKIDEHSNMIAGKIATREELGLERQAAAKRLVAEAQFQMRLLSGRVPVPFINPDGP